MKPLYFFVVLCLACLFTDAIQAQNQQPQQQQQPSRRQRQNAGQKSGTTDLSVRAGSKNEDQTQNIDNVIWLKEIYRDVDLTKKENSPLYYPVQPIENRMNLFTTIFKLICEGKIKAYDYLADGREVFTDQHLVKVEDILKKYGIIYKAEKRGSETVYLVEDSDVPSNEATLYLIKEAWYFNQANGTFDKKILAICPMLVREEFDMGGQVTRNPLFWVPYENIRPYASRSFIMTSDVNNALTYTTDDFFRKGMYKGDIIKTTNMMNKTLREMYGDSVKVAQDSIEAQLVFFEKKLWVPVDSTQLASGKKDKKEDKKSSSNARGNNSSSDKKEEKKKEEKTKKPKTDNSSSSPTKSVRRTR